MADIFISYSSRDREKAEQLTELLSSSGLSVWIDHSGIDIATSWSEEIVEAIDDCKAFIVMLSPSSILSHNVIKEVSLASEKRKKILPLDLEPVELPKNLQYALAGIQRSPMTNIDAIIRALGKLGLDAAGPPQPPKIVNENDNRKSLIIFPFEDLSPTQDNQWFADGLAGELIDTLGHIKSLRILDRKTSLDLRGVKQTTVEIGKLFKTRYFIEGSVRKFGDQIKISVSLLDIEGGDHLWQESYKGVMNDIFELQETVAAKVVEGLKLHLTKAEQSKLGEHGTENAEAYELGIKATEYFNLQTREGYRLALDLLSEAIRLDPGYAHAHLFKAAVLAELYRKYDRDPAMLKEGEELGWKAFHLNPDQYRAYYPLSQIYLYQGKPEKAEEMAKEFVAKDPQNSSGHFALGFFYANTGQAGKSIAPYEEALRLNPDSLSIPVNLATANDSIGDMEKRRYWASAALPNLERHLKLHPHDEHRRVQHAILLQFTGRSEEAEAEALQLTNLKDGLPLYNIACLFAMIGNQQLAFDTLRKSIEAGFRHLQDIKAFLADDIFFALRGTPVFEEMEQTIKKIEDEESVKKSNG